MAYELIITQKAKAAQKIAEVLSNNNLKSFSVGQIKYYLIGDKYIVTGVSGHITKRTYASRFKVWSKIEINELIEAKPNIEYDPIYKQYFKQLMKTYRIDSVGLYTDDDMEGQLIAADVLKMLNTDIVSVRYRTSSLDKTSVLNSFKNPGCLSKELVDCAQLRHKIDLQWGSTLSVMFTLYAKTFHSVGRVQTPVLNLLVERAKLIKQFVPKVFSTIELFTKQVKFESEQLELQRGNNLLKIMQKLKQFSYTEKVTTITRVPPKPLNITDLMQLGNSIKLSGLQTMHTAQSLYLKGIISYPRTNSRFTDYETIYRIFNKLNLLEKIQNKTAYSIQVGQKDSAHPPIMPTGSIPEDLVQQQKTLYNKIIEHYTKILQGKNVVEAHFYQFIHEGVKFKGYQQRTLIKGFRTVADYKSIPSLLTILDVKLVEHTTKKPPMYTESKLIKKMEQLRIGTKSTRHTFAEVLRRRGYINKMQPTQRGILFLQILTKYVRVITEHNLTANIESDLEKIIEVQTNKNEVDKKYTEILRNIVHDTIIKNRANLMHQLSATRKMPVPKRVYSRKKDKFRGSKTKKTR